MNTRILLILATLVLGIGAHTDRAVAYEMSEYDKAAAMSPNTGYGSYGTTGTPGERETQRNQMDQYQAQRNFEDQQRLANQGHSFSPRDYTGPAPFSFSDGTGRTTVCRHGYNNSVVCER